MIGLPLVSRKLVQSQTHALSSEAHHCVVQRTKWGDLPIAYAH